MFRSTLMILGGTMLAASAWAGTTTIGFSAGLGPLANGTNANLTANGTQACFSGANTTLLGASGTLSASGTISMQITLLPSSANPTFGLTLVGNAGTSLTAVTDALGNVTLSNDLGLSDTTFFSAANAANDYMRLEYDTATDSATVFVPLLNGGERSATIQGIALDGATGFQLGVISSGSGGCIDNFVATGPSIPNYVDPTPTVIHFKLAGTQQVPSNSSIATGCGIVTLSADQTTMTVHIEHGVFDPTMAHIHFGVAGVNGGITFPFTNFVSPIDQVFSVTAQNASDLLAGKFYANIHSNNFPGGEIRGQIVNDPSACTVTVDTGPIDTDGDGTLDVDDAFPHNPYGQTDSDHDGLGDEWEIAHFGNLSTADGTTDTDNDGVSDVIEFQNAGLGFDPLDNTDHLPLLGGAGLASLSALLITSARRRR